MKALYLLCKTSEEAKITTHVYVFQELSGIKKFDSAGNVFYNFKLTLLNIKTCFVVERICNLN